MAKSNSSVVKASNLGPKVSAGSISVQLLWELFFIFFLIASKSVIRLFNKYWKYGEHE